jgi:phytoene desaturase
MNKASAPKAVVIGSGFAGLSAASHLAKRGFAVTLLEKNEHIGGRARQWSKDGFVFDMGPSWYWMPDVFEHFFAEFGKKVSDYYELERLDPGYRIVFGPDDSVDIPADLDALYALFDSIEKGSGEKLREFLAEAAIKYEVGINDLVYKPGRSLLEFADLRVLKGLMQMHLLRSIRSHVKKFVRHPKLQQILEFPILFLGGTPENTPALYSLMNYADMVLGTWYPKTGMYAVVKAMARLAEELGVTIHTNQEVTGFTYTGNEITGVVTKQGQFEADVVIAGADYHHVEQALLPQEFRTYSQRYWDNRKLAPSSLIFFLGLDCKLDKMLHHTLFFDRSFDDHAYEIYDEPKWPSQPLFYTSMPSISDKTVAPEGKETLYILIPVAPDLTDEEATREVYYNAVMDRLESLIGQNVRDHVVVKRSYAHRDFISDYHSFKGNAYGLANTLSQTAILKPTLKNKKLKNLYYTGQLTIPGPGVPPSLISGEVVAKEIAKDLKVTTHEVIV